MYQQNKEIELEFVASNRITFRKFNYHEINQYDIIDFAIIVDDDVYGSALVVAHEVEWSLVKDLNCISTFHSPFFTFHIFPKCPTGLWLTLLIGFCQYFLQSFPDHKAIYYQYYSDDMKELLLKHGFKYFEKNLVYFQLDNENQNEEGSA